MSKVKIVGPKGYFVEALAVLHRLGVMQIEDLSKKIAPGDTFMHQMAVDPRTVEDRNKLGEQLSRIGAIVSTLEPTETERKRIHSEEEEKRLYQEVASGSNRELLAAAAEYIEALGDKAKEFSSKRKELENQMVSLMKYGAIVRKLAPLARRLATLEGYESIALLVEKKYRQVFDLIQEKMRVITNDQFEIVSADVDEESTAAILVFNGTYSKEVRSFLWRESVNEVRLPENLANQPFGKVAKAIKKQREEIAQEIEKTHEELLNMSKEWYVKLLALKEALQDRLEELKYIGHLAETDYTFMVHGWVPTKYLSRSRKAIRDQFGESVILDEVKVTPAELAEAPVVYENPSFVKPYELIMRLFQPPRYGTIDPTPFLALFFPIFFGMMLGDIGYGLALIGICLFLRRRYKHILIMKPVTTIFISAGVSAILFGFLYGEFFGDIPHLIHIVRPVHIMGIELPLDRMKSFMPLMFMVLGVGAAQIFFGLILGVVNAIKEKSKKHVIEKGGLLVVLLSIFLIVIAMVAELKVLMTPAYILILIGLVLLIYGGGLMGALEIFGTLGNIFSYIRILALGLAGVILAIVANQMAGAVGNIFVGVLVASILHMLNIIVGTFSPTIHGLRLNLLEFFNKFVERGGKEYKPFKRVGGGE
jgi:V/A-type H+-transporting ATPase subunit I